MINKYSIAATVLLTFTSLSPSSLGEGKASDRYDRLDGLGASGKKVDVIEWAGNLEIHVYPAKSLAGLGLTLTKKNGKNVMVAAYRFANIVGLSKPLVRRFLVSVPMRPDFKVYRDKDAAEYDKIIITNHQLAGNVELFALDSAPTQLYPDGHPALATKQLKEPEPNRTKARVPANTHDPQILEPKDFDADTGTIRPYKW